MNFKWYLDNLNRFTSCAAAVAISFFTITSFTVYGFEGSYELTKVAQLEHQLISHTNWQQLVTNPSNKRQYFVINESGQIYLVDEDKIEPQAVLDMRAEQKQPSSFFKLTALELHPNFSFRNQPGYGTFYTAHLENLNKKSKTIRLQERASGLKLRFDAVITEWQLNAVTHKKVELNTKREVLRVGIPDKSMMIKQLSFNPYIKSWNDHFGLLYVALNGNKKWDKPLYSGAILRINPTKLGLRNFTVPTSNPYLDNNEINDAVYLLGGQEIKQFIWPNKGSEQLLVSHLYDGQHLLALSGGKNDWRNSHSKKVIYQSKENAVADMAMYQGKLLPLLRSKLLLLSNKNQQWHVDSLTLNFSGGKKTLLKQASQKEWRFTAQQIPKKSQIILNRNHYGEIYLLDRTRNLLFRLMKQTIPNENLTKDDTSNDNAEMYASTDNMNLMLLVLLILALVGFTFYWFKHRGYSVKGIVKRQFATLEVSESSEQIGLYHRHQRTTETIINIADIVSSEVKLNKQSINLINDQLGYGFNNEKEDELRTIFANEKVHKMVDGKIRQVSLLLTDKQKHSYTVCLYMRKGSNRITKKSYVKVINELIDWCWLIGEKLNEGDSEQRKASVETTRTIKVAEDLAFNKVDNTSLHHQAAAIRPTNKDEKKVSKLVEPEELPQAQQSPQTQKDTTVDTELVNALEKLVNLKQQGFLTMDEFSKAKEKLLKDLLER